MYGANETRDSGSDPVLWNVAVTVAFVPFATGDSGDNAIETMGSGSGIGYGAVGYGVGSVNSTRWGLFITTTGNTSFTALPPDMPDAVKRCDVPRTNSCFPIS